MKMPQVAGFSTIQVAYSDSVNHVLYVRAQQQKAPSTSMFPADRTLFVVNVPPDATEPELKSLFASAGKVERVLFGRAVMEEEEEEDDEDVTHDVEAEEEEQSGSDEEGQRKKKPKVTERRAPKVIPLPPSSARYLRKTGHTAHIIFASSASPPKALAISSAKWQSSSEPSGLAHYLTQHTARRPPLSAIRAHADSSLEVYEHQKALSKQNHPPSQYRKGEPIVDDEGFTLVTRGGAYGKTVGGGVGVASKKFQNEMSRKNGDTTSKRGKKKKKVKEDFYKFQLREKKLKEHIELKKNLEKDLEKVAKLKESRKFKPY